MLTRLRFPAMQGVFHRDLKLVRLCSLVTALRVVAFALKPSRMSHALSHPVKHCARYLCAHVLSTLLQENTLIDRKPSTAPRLKICDFGYSKARAASLLRLSLHVWPCL